MKKIMAIVLCFFATCSFANENILSMGGCPFVEAHNTRENAANFSICVGAHNWTVHPFNTASIELLDNQFSYVNSQRDCVSFINNKCMLNIDYLTLMSDMVQIQANNNRYALVNAKVCLYDEEKENCKIYRQDYITPLYIF